MKQKGESDCGAAVLATVARHYGRVMPMQKLRALTGTGRGGASLQGLAAAAEALGFEARAIECTLEVLAELPLPAVAHWRDEQHGGHFVVVHKVTRRKVVVADPGHGIRTLSRQAFEELWTGYLLVLLPGERFAAAEDDAPPPGPWRRLLGLLRPNARTLVEALFSGLLLTVLGVSVALFIQVLVDTVLARGDATLLNVLGVGMLLLLGFRGLFSALRGYLLAHVGRRVDLTLISRYTHHVLHQPLTFFEQRRTGEIVSRLHDAQSIREAVSGTTLTLLLDSVLVVVSFVVMLACDPRLALVAGVCLPGFVLLTLAHRPRARRLSRRAMEHHASLQARLVEDVVGARTVKACGAESRRSAEADDLAVAQTQSVFDLQMTSISLGTLSMILGAAAGLALLWYGGHRVMSGALTVGQLLFFYALLGNLLAPLERLSSVSLQLQDALVALDRFGDVLDQEPEQLHRPGGEVFSKLRQGIRLEQVSFGYGRGGDVISGLSFDVPAGKTVAIVGESGSGKSTLLKLLQRFYEPTAGRILADGIDLRDYELASLRAGIGVVSQEPYLFDGTVRENIAFARPDATLQEVAAAARAAGLAELIESMPERYETPLGEGGANLSGGQRQRMAIARALLEAPGILIFDEATSHLDTRTERAIHESLREATRGRTVILVAHRLSTVREADVIHVLAGGKIVERGCHDELIAHGGRYAELWRAQTGADEDLYVILDAPPTPPRRRPSCRPGRARRTTGRPTHALN